MNTRNPAQPIGTLTDDEFTVFKNEFVKEYKGMYFVKFFRDRKLGNADKLRLKKLISNFETTSAGIKKALNKSKELADKMRVLSSGQLREIESQTNTTTQNENVIERLFDSLLSMKTRGNKPSENIIHVTATSATNQKTIPAQVFGETASIDGEFETMRKAMFEGTVMSTLVTDVERWDILSKTKFNETGWAEIAKGVIKEEKRLEMTKDNIESEAKRIENAVKRHRNKK